MEGTAQMSIFEQLQKKYKPTSEMTQEERFEALQEMILSNVDAFYQEFNLPIRFGDLFRRYNSRMQALGINASIMLEALEDNGKIHVENSPNNRRYIFPIGVARSMDEAELFSQVKQAEDVLGRRG